MHTPHFEHWLHSSPPPLDTQAIQKATKHQSHLTKPAGSLGKLEQLAIRFAGFQGKKHPVIDNIHISVFATDHGIANEGVSAFPQAVTQEMVRNFSHGGAAICVLARENNAKLEVINAGVATQEPALDNIINTPVSRHGTANFTQTAAMTHEQLNQALAIGYEAAKRAHTNKAHVFIGGEMGIANTSSASAIASALLCIPAINMTGSGTGIDQKGINHKVKIIEQALLFHAETLQTPIDILRCLGGFEIAALVGAMIHAAQLGVPTLVDGFISTVAALLAVTINPSLTEWLIYAHQSAEPAYKTLMQALQTEPLLDLGLRLGEGSGAAIAIPLLKQAVALHQQMATFADAEISGKIEQP
jgi:nicotinate-nucleotide--dimethylbenzimidazole phosphoribosyltransferase